MSIDEETVRTLNRIAAILQVAHKEALAELRAEILDDPTNNAILAVSSKWIATGELEQAALKNGAASRTTLFRRLGELVDRGILERRESGATVEYRASGLI